MVNAFFSHFTAGQTTKEMSTPFHPSSPALTKVTENDLEEAKHFKHIVKSFASFQFNCEQILNKYFRDYEGLSEPFKIELSEYPQKIEIARVCVKRNQEFLHLVIHPHRHLLMEEDANVATVDGSSVHFKPSTLNNVEGDNLRSLLRQVSRDWSEDGQVERDACYSPLLSLLETAFPPSISRNKVRVLVPGAGLGRLAYEISQLGFSCQGNDFSLFVLLTAEFILTRNIPKNLLEIYPYALPFSNTINLDTQFKSVKFPDIELKEAPVDFSMIAGDFIEVYGEQKGCWDAIVTCYFIDTAKNIVQYIQMIYDLLIPGGTWINSGPLLYHFEGHSSEPSIELSVEEIRKVCTSIGFEFKMEQFNPSTYCQNPSSMHVTTYNCWTFHAQKK